MDRKTQFRISQEKLPADYNEGKNAHRYYNITLINPTNLPSNAYYIETRSDPILEDPEKYHMSIERFDIPCAYLPLQIVESISGQTGTSGQGFVISYTGVNSDVNNRGTVVSPVIPDYTGYNGQPIGIDKTSGLNSASHQEVSSSSSWVYYYESYLDCYNSAIADAESYLKTIAPTYSVDFTPFFSYNPNSQLITLNAPQQYNMNITGAPQLQWGSLTQYYLQSIPVIYANQEAPSFPDCTAKIYPRGGPSSSQVNGWQSIQIPNTLTPTYFTGICLSQEWASLTNWQYPKTLQFLTNTIPVTLQDINNQNLGTISDASSLVFTNFDIPLGVESRSVVQFYIQGERRLIDLNGNVPLKQMGWTLYWSDQYQNLIPLYLPPYQSIGVLVQFIKKDHYHG